MILILSPFCSGENKASPVVKVICSSSALQEVEENAAYLRRKIVDDGVIIYGINTGFGDSADVRSQNLPEMQLALLRHVNAGMGQSFPVPSTRAATAVRLNCLLKAYSGVRPIVPETMAALLNADIMPEVPLRGSVSASGDLMPLSYVAATVMGRDTLRVRVPDGGADKVGGGGSSGIRGSGHKTIRCPEALAKAGISPVVLGPKEGLAIVNASSFAAGVACPTVYDTHVALLLTQVCTGLAVEALQGRMETFHPVLHEGHVGQREIGKNLAEILEGTRIATTQLEMNLPDRWVE